VTQIHNLSASPSAIDNYMYELRSVEVQNDREKFRNNIQKIGRAIGYEISKTLAFNKTTVQTPLKEHVQSIIEDEVVVVTILRAGLPLHEGILDVFPQADNGFISAYRKHDGDDFVIEVEYVACPSLENKVLILNDPMLATGQSFINAWKALSQFGKPKRVILAAVIGSEEGVQYIQKEAEDSFDLWVAAIDPVLNDQKYIVPGLGDAGDLAFGTKIQR
jgi:uracil phosphoribosyltransferase